MKRSLLVGLMSGTSLDAIDAVLLAIEGNGSIQLLECLEYPLDDSTRANIAALSQPGEDEIPRLGLLDRQLGRRFAQATIALLSAAKIDRSRISAIGSHGQTIRHHPPSIAGNPRQAFTLQIGDPATIAEMTGITTVADFRRRDVAAGGEGAPLVPAFHAAAFADSAHSRAIVNIGGIANMTLLAGDSISGCDTGPGNTLIDHWIARHQGQHYDANGAWSAEGRVNNALLAVLMEHPFLGLSGPRSTGKEAFNLEWLDEKLQATGRIDARDVQSTLAEYTAATIEQAIAGQPVAIEEVYICGGGAANDDLMRRLFQRLRPRHFGSTAELGIDPAWVEAAAFAWLAHRTLQGQSGNIAAVTGASGERILGAIHLGG